MKRGCAGRVDVCIPGRGQAVDAFVVAGQSVRCGGRGQPAEFCRRRGTVGVSDAAFGIVDGGVDQPSGRVGQVSALIGVAKIASRAIRTSRSILGSRGVS